MVGMPGTVFDCLYHLSYSLPVFSPGRFLAVNEVKALLAHILLNYDVQLENGSMERPPNLYIESSVIPNQKAKVMFRKRRVD